MIAPDANLLIYAYTPTAPMHVASKAWLERILSSAEPVGIPIHSIYAFLRIVSNPRIAGTPVPMRIAIQTIDSWLVPLHVRLLYPGHRHWESLKLLLGANASGSLVTDAAIAATAMEYGAIIHTNDRDFSRFPNVRWINPLQS